jgi:hypothetical protein
VAYSRGVERASRRRSRAGVAAICLVGVAAALVFQPVGCNQTAHLALVEALTRGTPRIDAYAAQTCDTAYIDGHYFAAKAPGLALATAPWYGALRIAGLAVDHAPATSRWPQAMLELPRRATWQVSIVGATLAALVLLLLVRATAERIVPGYGAAAAVLLGIGSLLLPFSTLFFAHVLSAMLGLAAFSLLVRDRTRSSHTPVVVLAGLLAGLAIVVEFPLGILALALAAYAGRARVVPYAVGLAGGILPLAAFNTWAFGSPFDLSYEHAVIQPGASGHDVIGANDKGLFGVTVPSLRSAAELLASDKGLLVLTPLAAAGIGGLIVLLRGAARREATLALAVCGGFLLYNSAYFLPFGGWVPGPRFLIPVLPFVGLGIAAALRAAPLTTAALAAPSVLAMVGATLAEPLTEPGAGVGLWLDRWRDASFTSTVVTEAGGGNGWPAVAPVLVLLGVALGLAAWSLPQTTLARRDLVVALVAFGSWLVLAHAAPGLLALDRGVHQATGLAAVVVLVAVAILSCVTAARGGATAAAGVLLLGLLLAPGVSSHSKWALLVVLASGGIVAVSLGRMEPST